MMIYAQEAIIYFPQKEAVYMLPNKNKEIMPKTLVDSKKYTKQSDIYDRSFFSAWTRMNYQTASAS